nr:SDR family NAD(P)-dependent oxidoreductase [Mycobacterium kyorinense]
MDAPAAQPGPEPKVRPMSADERDITGKKIVITGATDGIGKELARAMIRRGGDLTLIARNANKAEAVASELGAEPGAPQRPDVVVADLADLGAVRRAADQIHDQLDRIDVLVNNAGAHYMSAHPTVDGLDQMMVTNHLGPFLLTNLLLDLLQKAAPSRIVVTASEAHRTGGRVDLDKLAAPTEYGAIGSERRYGQSKLMNILFTQELARRLDGSGVTVNCFCPGVNATGLVRESRLLTRAAGVLSATRVIRRPEVGARMGVRLVVDPALENVTGQFFTSTPGLRYLPAVRARRNRDYQRRAWERSAELVGL